MEQFVTPQEAARMLKRSRRTVYRMMKNGMFKNMRSFGEGHRKIWYLDRSEIEALLARRGAPAQRQATAEQQRQPPAELPRSTVDLVNLTPREVVVYTSTHQRAFSVPPLGVVARVERTHRQIAVLNGVPVLEVTSAQVVGLPEPQLGVAYIVAEEVLAAVDRDDVYAPGPALRPPDARVAGCVGLRTRSRSDRNC